MLLKRQRRRDFLIKTGAGIIALGILAWFAGSLSPLLLSIATTAIMIIVAVWESTSLRSGAAEPRSEATGA